MERICTNISLKCSLVTGDHVKIGFWLSQTVGRNAGGGDNGKNAQKLDAIIKVDTER